MKFTVTLTNLTTADLLILEKIRHTKVQTIVQTENGKKVLTYERKRDKLKK